MAEVFDREGTERVELLKAAALKLADKLRRRPMVTMLWLLALAPAAWTESPVDAQAQANGKIDEHRAGCDSI